MKKQGLLFDPIVRHTAIGVLAGVVATLLMMLVCALILTLKDFEPSAATPLSNVSVSVGALLAGFITTYIHKSKGLVLGAVSGLALFALISVVALFVNGGNVSINTLFRLIVMTVLSAAGGVFGVNISAKRKMI